MICLVRLQKNIRSDVFHDKKQYTNGFITVKLTGQVPQLIESRNLSLLTRYLIFLLLYIAAPVIPQMLLCIKRTHPEE